MRWLFVLVMMVVVVAGEFSRDDVFHRELWSEDFSYEEAKSLADNGPGLEDWFEQAIIEQVKDEESLKRRSSSSSSSSRKRQNRLPRPELTHNRVLPMEASIMNQKYEYLVTSLQFDQDLYLNEPFVCAGQDLECANQTCVPCDWTGENRTGCFDNNCCGPSQWPQLAQYSKRGDWCDDSLPPFTKLNFGEFSEKVQLAKDEYSYFRFFIGDEEHCKPISITVHTDFGQTQLLVHNFMAYPSYNNLLDTNANYRQTYRPGLWYRSNGAFNYAQSVLDICPNVNPIYSKGTYSVAVRSLSEFTRFSVELRLGEDEYPLLPPEPEDAFNCSDVPDEEFSVQTFGDPSLFGGSICLDEGVTREYLLAGSDNSKYFNLILPVMPGCREIQFAYNGFTGQLVTGSDGDTDLFCFQSSESTSTTTAFLARSRAIDDTFYFAGCFEEVTFIHCTAQSFSGSGAPAMFYWTSHATPRRYKMSELSPGQMAMVTGVSHAGSVAPGLAYEALSSWGFNGLSYITQPTTDPVVFWPPIEPYMFNFSGTPSEIYQQAVKSEVKDNLLVVVDITTRNNREIRNRMDLLETGFIAILGITNIEGTPVKLANDGQMLSNYSFTEWAPHQTFKNLDVQWDYSALCDSDSYYRQLALANSLTTAALQSTSLDSISAASYGSDIFGVALARSACIQAVQQPINIEAQNFSSVQINYCPYDFESEAWLADPCCNIKLQSWMCCDPQSVEQETDLHVGVDDGDIDNLCDNSNCAESYFDDISKSLNSRGNPLLGCSNGIQDPNYELSVLFEREMASFVRPCLERSGFGDQYEGVPCTFDDDCDAIGLGCSKGLCNMGSTEEAQNRYLDCFLEEMTSPVENYIRNTVLAPVDSWFPRDSSAFRWAVTQALTIDNCVNPDDPLDVDFSERWVIDSPIYCKAFSNSYNAYTQISLINESCPTRTCLGEKTCRYDSLTNCRQVPSRCEGYSHTYFAPNEEACPVTQECNYGDLSDCSGYACVYCDEDKCEEVDLGVDSESITQEMCESLVMCESNEEKRIDLSVDECQSQEGSCTTLCPIESCVNEGSNIFKSLDRPGLCVFPTLTNATQCEAEGFILYTFGSATPSCMPGVNSYTHRDDCEALGLERSLPVHYTTCEDLSVEVCHGQDFPDTAYYYIFCDVEDFSPCPTKEECLNNGAGCTDLDSLTSVSWRSGIRKATNSYGRCFASGVAGATNLNVPFCYWPDGENAEDISCVFGLGYAASQEQCALYNTTGENDVWRRASWLTPASTKEECFSEEYGRYGCVLPDSLAVRPFFWLEDGACECNQGTLQPAFHWNVPKWREPVAYPLQWVPKEAQTRYQWASGLSLGTMEKWVEKAMEELFVVTFQSQVVCQNNYLTSSLTTLVCDCFGGDDQLDSGENCFSTDDTTRVGLSLACANEIALLKGPPSFTTFSRNSIKSRCTQVTLDLIPQSLFLYSPANAAVSFQFAHKRQKGVVLNGNDATVGEVMGDGSQLIFSLPELVRSFQICLLISLESDNDAYTVPDFGSPSDNFDFIRPLGVKGIEEVKEESSVYWCADIGSRYLTDDGGTAGSFFPVLVREDSDDYKEDPYDHQTTSLVYTLAACYCLDLVVLLVYLVVIVRNVVRGGSVPPVAWVAVLFMAVCVFRITFCFIYVDGGFEDSQLTEYVLFELPTFLLFTAVILAIALFVRLSKKSTFDFKGVDKNILITGLIAIACVWSLFIAVTVIYSEVILEEESESLCPGRIPDDSSKQEDDARTLSIVYQSIVIFLTLCFALFFLRSAVKLFLMSKNAEKAKRFIFRIGSVIVASFLLRSGLFLLLLILDLTSDIYLFITLMLTEVVMMFLIALEFNEQFYNRLASSALSSLATSRNGTTGTGLDQTDVSVLDA